MQDWGSPAAWEPAVSPSLGATLPVQPLLGARYLFPLSYIIPSSQRRAVARSFTADRDAVRVRDFDLRWFAVPCGRWGFPGPGPPAALQHCGGVGFLSWGGVVFRVGGTTRGLLGSTALRSPGAGFPPTSRHGRSTRLPHGRWMR